MLKKSLLAGLVAVIIMTGSSVCGVAVGAEKTRDRPSTGDKGTVATAYETNQMRMVLKDKGDTYFLFSKRRFEVTSGTVVKDESGRVIISFNALKVPCEAVVTYYKKPGKRNTYVAVSIESQGDPKPMPD
jgi:hypothetical protein